MSKNTQRPRRYLAEAYSARSSAAGITATAERVAAAAAALTAAGYPIRYLHTLFVPTDETTFHLFEANTESDVAETVRRAGIKCERIVECLCS